MTVQKSNLNLNNGEFYLEYNYINLAKRMQRVITTAGGPATWYRDLTEDQYPTETTYGITSSIRTPVNNATYVVRWLGSGSVTFGSTASHTNSSSGVYTGGGANGSIVTNGRFTFVCGRRSTITIKGTTINSLVVCLASEEAAFDGGQIFRDRFLSLIAQYNPGSLRFMDAQSINTNVTGYAWDLQPSLDCITYHGHAFPKRIYAGPFTGTDTYAASSYTGMPATYEHGEICYGTFDNANTGTTATIDVGGRGAKSLYYHGGNLTANRITANAFATLYFDQYYDAWFFDLALPKSGVSVQALVQMCNATGVPGWFCTPYYASDAWITSFANYLVANYTPSVVYVEMWNEGWNSGFFQYSRAAQAGTVLWGMSDNGLGNSSGYRGYRLKQIAAIMRPIFAAAGKSSKLKLILAGKGSNGDSGTPAEATKLFENTATNTTGTLGTPNASLGGANAPILSADYVSYGLYYGSSRTTGDGDSGWTSIYNNPPGGETGINAILAAADDWASGDATRQQEAVDFMYDSCLASQASVIANRFVNWNNAAAAVNKPVLMYEVNHEWSAPSASWCTGKGIDSSYGGTWGKIDNLLIGFMNSPEYDHLVSVYISSFNALSKSEGWSLYGMCLEAPWVTFPLVEASGTSGQGDTMQEPFKNWTANARWNNGLRRYQLTTS